MLEIVQEEKMQIASHVLTGACIHSLPMRRVLLGMEGETEEDSLSVNFEDPLFRTRTELLARNLCETAGRLQ